MLTSFRAAAAAAAVLLAGAATAQTVQHVVYFPLDSDRLTDEARDTLDAAAANYAETGDASVSIVGHADTTGSEEYNLALSERRAEAVTAALASRGVPEALITAGWRGDNDLAVETADGVAEPLNRRAEVAFDAAAPAPVAAAPIEVETPDRFAIGLGPYVGVNLQEDDESTFVGANLTASIFATPNIAVSAEQAGFYSFGSDDEGWGGRSVGGLDYHFADWGGDDGFSPYVGANAGWTYVDGSAEGGFTYGPEIGVSAYGATARVAYDFIGDRDAGNGVISVTVGYDVRF